MQIDNNQIAPIDVLYFSLKGNKPSQFIKDSGNSKNVLQKANKVTTVLAGAFIYSRISFNPILLSLRFDPPPISIPNFI